MVEDFDVQLVSADQKYNDRNFSRSSRRIPFQEHTRGTKTYVEVEPDEEYFISIDKIRRSTHRLYTDYYVDGKSLHFHVTWERDCISDSPRIVGIHSRENGIKTTHALKFVKATFTSAASNNCISNKNDLNDSSVKKESIENNSGDGNYIPSSSSSMAGMGQIQMMVFEAIPKQVKKRGKIHPASSFSASTIDLNPAAVSKSRITSTKKMCDRVLVPHR